MKVKVTLVVDELWLPDELVKDIQTALDNENFDKWNELCAIAEECLAGQGVNESVQVAGCYTEEGEPLFEY